MEKIVFSARGPAVKYLTYVLLFMLFVASSARAQRPRPPGQQQADQAEAQAQQNIPPPLTSRAAIDSVKLKHEADELAALAQSVPPEVDQTTKGLLPKDLGEKLKRIEKLAKQLRGELVP
jgi:hypothetical protein